MKKIKLIAFLTALLIASSMQGQISVSLNIGNPPQWGPVGYAEARNYYLPDVEAYYDIQSSRFIYLSGGTWVHRTYLPTRYRNYDLYNGYKVVMTDYRGHQPYSYYKQHRVKYAKGYRGHEQRSIGNHPSKVKSYKVQQPSSQHGGNAVRGNDNHDSNKHGHGNEKGHDKGRK